MLNSPAALLKRIHIVQLAVFATSEVSSVVTARIVG